MTTQTDTCYGVEFNSLMGGARLSVGPTGCQFLTYDYKEAVKFKRQLEAECLLRNPRVVRVSVTYSWEGKP